MSRRRLTHVVESLEPWGTQRLMSLIARRLPAAEYAQRVVALRAEMRGAASCRDELEAAGIEVATIGRRDPDDDSFLRTTWKLRHAISPAAADLVHLWDDVSITTAGPWVNTADVGPQVLCSVRGMRRDSTWLVEYLERRVLQRAEAIVNNATVYRHRLRALDGHGAKIHSVPSDPIELRPSRTPPEIRAALGVGPTTKLIGTACRLTPDANVRDLLFAGALLMLVHKDFRIVVCGDGPALDELRRFATLMRMDDVTIFTGAKLEPDDLIPSLFAYVAPGYWTGPAREVCVALASGVPIIAADTPIHRAEFDVDRSGFLFAEHDQGLLTRHLHQLLNDAELHERMSAAARERAATLPSADEVVARYMQLYESTIAG